MTPCAIFDILEAPIVPAERCHITNKEDPTNESLQGLLRLAKEEETSIKR